MGKKWDAIMGKFYRLFFAWIAVFILFSASIQAQEVQRQGAISIEEASVTDDINGTRIVPELNENEGMIRLTVRQNSYFTIQDVARWIRNNEMTFDRVNIGTGNIIVRNDDSIQLRFTQDFIGDSQTVQRRIQIRHPEGHFENYFDFAQFYKQQVVNLEVGVEREPLFTEEFVPRGTLVVVSNESEADVVVFNERGERVADRLLITPNASGEGYQVEFLNIPIGSYTVRVSKDGWQTESLSNVEIANNQTTRESVEMEADDLGTGMGRIIVDTNLQEVDIEIRDQTRGVRQVYNIFSGYLSNEFAPGEYELRMTPEGFDPVIKTIQLQAGQTVEEQITMIRDEPVRTIAIASTPSNAQIRINGEYIGNTPMTLVNQEREEMVVELRLDRYRTVVDTLLLYSELDYTLFEEMQENYLRIDSSPSGFVYIDGEPQNNSPLTISSPEEREYEVSIVLPNYVRVDTTFDMAANPVVDYMPELEFEMANVRINPERTAIPISILIEGDNYSESFDDIASTELRMPYGNYTFTFSRPGFNDVSKRVSISEQSETVPYDLSPKSKVVSIALSAVLPGAGQWQWDNNKRGWLFFTAFAGAATFSVLEYSNYTGMVDEYNQTMSSYQSGNNPINVTEQGGLMESQYAAINEKKSTVDMVMMIAAGIYGINLIDRILFTKSPNKIYQSERMESSGTRMSLKAAPGGMSLKLNF